MAKNISDVLKRTIRAICLHYNVEINKHPNPVVSLQCRGKRKGRVLLSYVLDPFLLNGNGGPSRSHTHHWESTQIARTFLDLGFDVDVVHYLNRIFRPRLDYDVFVGARTNFERISALLKKDCLKIVHLDMSHWIVNNEAHYQRQRQLQARRGVAVKPMKIQGVNFAIEAADCGTVLGNDRTLRTYEYARKPLYPIPVPLATEREPAAGKDYESCRRRFLWFGSSGLVHKGLDLTLEAFAAMPEFQLDVCATLDEEKDFERAYFKELHDTANIHYRGWMDVGGDDFSRLCNECVGLIYPTCAEGQSGGVVTCMQAGLIPVASAACGVDLDCSYGIPLEENSVEGVRSAVRKAARLEADELSSMSFKAWQYASRNHSKEKYSEVYRDTIESILQRFGASRGG